MKEVNKILKKISIAILSIMIIIGICSNTSATELKTKLEIIQNASETKYLENEQGEISKTIVESNADTGEVTIELKLSNTSSKTTIVGSNKEITDSEIIILIDDSDSMKKILETGISRRETVQNASKGLVNNLFNNYTNVKIGIIKFGSKSSWNYVGSEEDAKKMCELTNDKDTVISAIEKKSNISNNTNLEAGILLAEQEFSNNCENKIIIILSDGQPNVVIENDANVKETTKNSLIDADSKGIKIITMLTEIENEVITESVFGTVDNPTVGKFYYIKDADINKVITENIYSDVSEMIKKPNNEINNVKVVDYFPENIKKNFEFSYVENPNLGTVSEGIDSANNTITWDIEKLKGNEVATLRYKLKIKDMKNPNLLNQTIATNEKVVLTYKDTEDKDYTVTLSSSPKIKLSEIKDEANSDETNGEKNAETNGETKTEETNVTEDKKTQAQERIPDTGANMTLILVIVSTIAMAVVIYKKYSNYKNIK